MFVEPTIEGVRQWRSTVEHGFPTPGPLHSAIYLKGEIAELLMAYHKTIAPGNHKRNPDSTRAGIVGEFGDCILMLFTYAGHVPGLDGLKLRDLDYDNNEILGTAQEVFHCITNAEWSVNQVIGDRLYEDKATSFDTIYLNRIYTSLFRISELLDIHDWQVALNQTTAKIKAAFLS